VWGYFVLCGSKRLSTDLKANVFSVKLLMLLSFCLVWSSEGKCFFTSETFVIVQYSGMSDNLSLLLNKVCL
jgi:hypothetical protein